MGKAEHHCLRCGGAMARGALRIRDPHHAPVNAAFVIPGVPTSWNPIAAFKQGLSNELGDEVIRLREIAGYLCRTCGHLELHAWIEDDSDDL